MEFVFVYIREAHPKDGWEWGEWSKVRIPRPSMGARK